MTDSNPGSTRKDTNETERRVQDLSWLSRIVGVGLCVAALGFVMAFGAVLASEGQIGLITKPLPVRAVLVLPYSILVLAAGTVVGSVLSWWKEYWSLAARLHQTLLALLGILLTWQLIRLGLL